MPRRTGVIFCFDFWSCSYVPPMLGAMVRGPHLWSEGDPRNWAFLFCSLQRLRGAWILYAFCGVVYEVTPTPTRLRSHFGSRSMLQLKVVLDRGVFRLDVPWGWQATRHPPSTWDTIRVTSVVVLGAGLQLDIGGRALRGREDLLALRGQSTLGSTPARACANLDTSGGAAAHRRCCGPHSVEPVGQQGIVRKCSKQARSFGLPQSIAVRLTSLLVKDTVHRPFSPKSMVAAGMSSHLSFVNGQLPIYSSLQAVCRGQGWPL